MARALTLKPIRWIPALAVALFAAGVVAFPQAKNVCVTLAPDAGQCVGVVQVNPALLTVQNNDTATVCYGWIAADGGAQNALCNPPGVSGIRITAGNSAEIKVPANNQVCLWSGAGTLDGGACWTESWPWN